MHYAGKKFLVAGLGASGVSAVRYLCAQEAEVHVTDAQVEPSRAPQVADLVAPLHRYYGGLRGAEPIAQYEALVVAPGISLQEPFVSYCMDQGLRVIGDIELFAQAANAPVVGITGSNGKSTVTTLVGEMARRAGMDVGIGGNLGPPALDLLGPSRQLYVLELSSFQLETTFSLRCQSAAILNLSQDHLDRHGDMRNYAAAKARIWQGCEVRITNRDDSAVMGLAASGTGALISFGVGRPVAGEYGVIGDTLCLADQALLHVNELRIFGSHNVSNALAALALADAAGIPRAASIQALRNFRGLPHRCQLVEEIEGVRYFNDSKGTNVGSTVAAINGLDGKIVWLGGGQGKGQSFSELRVPLARKGKAAILFGQDAALIEEQIRGAVPVYREVDMQQALRRARSLVAPGDRVLLSPACASFDQFQNYVDRGDKFCVAVREFIRA